MTMHAKPPDRDLLAKFQSAKHRLDDWQALALWLCDFLERVHAARDLLDRDADLVVAHDDHLHRIQTGARPHFNLNGRD